MNEYPSRALWLVFFFLILLSPYPASAISITETNAAIGKDCVASGASSTAMGKLSTASGEISTTMGWNTEASGRESTAMGYATIASGYISTAMGENTTASAVAAISMGSYTTASGKVSTAMGFNTIASGYNSTSMGYLTTAGGDYSFAGGRYMQLTGAADQTFVWGYSDTAQSLATPDAFLIFPVGTKGKVGIGTPQPVERLHICERATDLGAAILLDSTGGAGGRQYYVGSTLASNIGGAGLFQIFDVAAFSSRFNIDASGNVGIGTTSPDYTLEVNGNAAKPGGGSWSVSSDERLKDITGAYEGGLSEILELRPVTFYYKEGNERGLPSDEEYVGFIAQEVREVFPEAVSEGPDGYLDFNMHPVNVAVVNAIKELRIENEAIRAENAMLKNDIEKIKAILGM